MSDPGIATAAKPAVHVESVGAGPPLVLLHGWGLHAGLFSTLLPALARRLETATGRTDNALVNAVQQDSFTPLHGAAQNGQIEMIKLLLEFGADPRRRTSDGKTPLDMAEAAGYSEAASFILIE